MSVHSFTGIEDISNITFQIRLKNGSSLSLRPWGLSGSERLFFAKKRNTSHVPIINTTTYRNIPTPVISSFGSNSSSSSRSALWTSSRMICKAYVAVFKLALFCFSFLQVCRSSLDLCSGFHSNSIWNSKGTGSGLRDKPNDAGTRLDDATWRPWHEKMAQQSVFPFLFQNIFILQHFTDKTKLTPGRMGPWS